MPGGEREVLGDMPEVTGALPVSSTEIPRREGEFTHYRLT